LRLNKKSEFSSSSSSNKSNDESDIEFEYDFFYENLSSSIIKKRYLDPIVREIVKIFKRYGKNGIKLFLDITVSNLIAKKLLSPKELKQEDFLTKNKHLIQAFNSVKSNQEKKQLLSIIQLEATEDPMSIVGFWKCLFINKKSKAFFGRFLLEI